ncbi:MAG: polyketide synthase, partial [Gammaproteobacteria bacterium]|nr:polyketide synthase [Gammaproteobacteria bacterium]NDG45482.1 polyketide synthase [Gammaproteobacteria bacterium]
PSVEGQAEVIQDALSMAQKAPDDVAFVEAHGTGTALGDEIELKALQQVFQSVETSSARYIGSLKSNFGHLDTAAGAAGMVKASLALVHGTVPPTASVTDPVDALKSNSPPFCLNKEPVPFPVSPTGTRCAGVSSFGIGGTNAHVILEQAPSKGDLIATRPGLIVPFSAPDEQRFELLCSEVQECIARDPAERAQLAYTMQIGRRQFSHRGYWVSSSGGSGDIVIRRGGQGGIVPQAEAPPVVFMFGGRDTLDPIALKGLFDGEPEFRREFLDAITHIECLKLEEPGLAEGLRALRQGLPGEWGGTALFCAEYAICKMWQRWGVEPAVLLGVSLGEFVAGVIAGTITFSEALRAVIRSDGLSTAYPMGQSAAVASGEERLR